nr:vesicle transport protein SFT2B [Ipomoea batatas]
MKLPSWCDNAADLNAAFCRRLALPCDRSSRLERSRLCGWESLLEKINQALEKIKMLLGIDVEDDEGAAGQQQD